MGHTVSAHAVIGYRLSKEELEGLITYTKVRNCEHSEQNGKFCSECGKAVWKDVADYYHAYDLLDTLKIPYETDLEYFYIGLSAEESPYSKILNFAEIDLAKNKAEADNYLTILNLKPENYKFGLWAVLYYS